MKLWPYFLLFFTGLLSIAFIPLIIPSGGTTWDGAQYIRLAYFFPDVKWDLWPLGYPLLIRFFHIITTDYYWAARILSVFCYLAIAAFSYFKKFHFKETVVLLCTKIFFFTLYFQFSEGPFLAVMYFLFYYFYEFYEGKIKGGRFYLPAGLLLFLLFFIRYSGLYIYAAFGLFYLIYSFRRNSFRNFFKNDFFFSLLVAGVGIFGYVLFNYVNFGDFMGERFRRGSDLKWFSEDFYMQVLSIFNAFNPVFGIKANSLSGKYIVMAEGAFFIINVFFIWFYIKLLRKNASSGGSAFYLLLTFSGIVYIVLMFASSFFQFLEVLNMRMLCEASMCFFFVTIFLYYKFHLPEKLIFMVAVFSVLFNSFYAIKIPGNFIKEKYETEKFLENAARKKYFFDDIKSSEGEVTYHIPVINKNIKYRHDNLQPGVVRANILMSKDPRIIYIFSDTVKDKSSVIYNSEIKRWEKNK